MNRFVFVTDAHYWPEAPRDYGAPKMLTHGHAIHEAMVPAINALNPDFILHGGDLLCGGSAFDLPTDVFERSIREVKEMVQGFQSPFYCVPGNHDCDAQSWTFDTFSEAFDTPEILTVHIARANIFLGDTRELGSGEWIDEHDVLLREADHRACESRTPTILCLHTWVLPDLRVEEGSDGRGCLKGAERLLATISECPSIIAVFTGHLHVNRITAYRDFLIVDTACLIGYPFGFREVTLSDGGWFSTRFHRLDIPSVLETYRLRDDAGEDVQWEGQPHDQDSTILIPRLQSFRA